MNAERNILEIIIACKEQQPATEEELRLCVVALSAMLYTVEREERELFEAVVEGKPSAKLRAEVCKRETEIRFKAKKMAPREYLGPSHTPGTPENENLARMAKAVFKKATGQDL